MVSNVKRMFKNFYIFDLHKEEDWLREMSNKGLHFKNIKFLFLYTFEKGESRDTIYKIDFNEKIYDQEEYYRLYSEYDFEYISKMRYFNYFKYTGDNENYKNMELYNNKTEELKWLKKYYYMILCCFVFEIAILAFLIIEKKYNSLLPSFPIVIIFLFCILILFTATKFSLSINRMKKIVNESNNDEY